MSDIVVVQQPFTQIILSSAGERGATGPAGPGGASGYYGAFSDYLTQTTTANTATAMLLRTTDGSSGVSVVSQTRITFANAGTYDVQWSGQFQNSDNQDHDVTVWLRKNGTDVTGSTGVVSVPSSHGAVAGHTVTSWNYVVTVAAADYLQFYWSADSTAVTIQTYPAGTTPVTPSTASLIVTAVQVMNTQIGPTGPAGPTGYSDRIYSNQFFT